MSLMRTKRRGIGFLKSMWLNACTFLLDSPKRFWWYHWFCWILSAVGIICILLAHDHYTVDVVVAYYITTRLFWWYHTMANQQVSLESRLFPFVRKSHLSHSRGENILGDEFGTLNWQGIRKKFKFLKTFISFLGCCVNLSFEGFI